MAVDLDSAQIKTWRSIVTLIVFVLTNVTVLFPFHVPIFIPRVLWDGLASALSSVRVIPKRIESSSKKGIFVRLDIPINFLTAPLIADLFLLAISAIGREEVKDGTLGTKNIFPIDIMAFFLTLAYIAISIDASGIIRWLAFKVLQKGGESGPKLFLYLYAFFFALATFIGNDPIILSGTAFLAYMTRVSSNIKHPRAWIHSQFAAANIGSAILVSSNPTNLVLAGAFGIKFIEYTANIIVPVVCTAIVLFPFLLYVVFPKEDEIPTHIEIHQLPEELLHRRAVNPNIPNARGNAEREERQNSGGDPNENLSLEEIMNPFLDKKGAGFGALIMTVTLITILALNAASQSTGEHPVFWVTLPAAFVMFCWDVAFGWRNREGTRKIARDGRAEIQRAIAAEEEEKRRLALESGQANAMVPSESHSTGPADGSYEATHLDEAGSKGKGPATDASQVSDVVAVDTKPRSANTGTSESESGATLVSIVKDSYLWCQETFPTVTAVVAHLPFALVPFAFAMFILVQALTTKGWVPVFAYGWDHWVRKTGTVGAIGGMGFLSVIMCNFAGTNIGTTILLCRIIQAWVDIHRNNGIPISKRTFWATVYSMALGVNYGAFSTAFSASLAGLLWRDILSRKYIEVSRSEFARVNLKIIAVSMAVGSAVLIGEVYITRGTTPYSLA